MAPEIPRGVSSRLLSMKFMQRAAASGSPAGSPDQSSSESSSKKRKLENSPAQGRVNVDMSAAAIQAAVDEREAKRQAALEKQSSSDTQWVLNHKLETPATGQSANSPLKIVYVGYGDDDSLDTPEETDGKRSNGRTSTRDYKTPSADKKPEKHNADDSNVGSSDEGSSDSGRIPSDGAASKERRRSRSSSRPRQKAEEAKAKAYREKRKKKEVPLSKLVSISSGGDARFSSSSSKSITCYNCNKEGHRASDCPVKGSRGSRNKS